jgi:hypothetical protein
LTTFALPHVRLVPSGCPSRPGLCGWLADSWPENMDHLHVTEFGSDRYLEKFNQSQANSASPAIANSGPSQSPFILPFRGTCPPESEGPPAKPSDQKRSEKKGLSFFRNKFQAKSSSAAAASSCEHPEQRPSSTHSKTAKQR